MGQSVKDKIDLRQGDITKLKIDCIINAANNSLLGGGGVDGAIHRAAGPQLLEECKALGGCPTGEARLTHGYKLPATYVIHTVGPVYTEKAIDEEHLTLCYKNSLKLAVDNQIKTLAFPAISCGVYGYPLDKASKVAIDTCREFLENETAIEKIIFILFSSDDFKIYQKYFASLGNF